MQRLAIGVMVGTAVWLASALEAEAQPIPIPPVGPTSISSDATQYTFTCTYNATAPFFIRVFDQYNGQGNPDFGSAYYTTFGPNTPVSVTVSTSGFPMVVGDYILQTGLGSYGSSFLHHTIITSNISIVPPGTSFRPSKSLRMEVEFADRDRKEWA